MKVYFLSILFISIFSFSQIGINNNSPTATLDISSIDSNPSSNILDVQSTSYNKLLRIKNNGNIIFDNLLYLENDHGTKGYVLASNGVNKKPTWVNINDTELNKYVAIAFNGNNISYRENEFFAANVSSNISFDEKITISSSGIGKWNSASKSYTILKDGIYEIVTGVKTYTTGANANRSGIMGIITGSQNQYFLGSKIINDNYSVDFAGKVTRFLTAGTEIKIVLYLNSQWRYDKTFLNITYSEKTNL